MTKNNFNKRAYKRMKKRTEKHKKIQTKFKKQTRKTTVPYSAIYRCCERCQRKDIKLYKEFYPSLSIRRLNEITKLDFLDYKKEHSNNECSFYHFILQYYLSVFKIIFKGVKFFRKIKISRQYA